MNAINEKRLMIPLYKLYYIEDVNDFTGFRTSDFESLSEEYTEAEILDINEAVKWAVDNPNYDFSSVFPDMKHSNEDIYKYIKILNTALTEYLSLPAS